MSGPDGDCSQAAQPAKVGVYVCHCGRNIAATVDVERVVASAATLPGVAVARDYKFMCSDPGQGLIKQDIRDGLVNRVVVASCSPLMHGETFRRATAAGGISPFYSQMASIREHVSWVTADHGDATEKAQALVAGAVRRVAAHEHLDRRRAPVRPDVLVVGGGIGGIHAALTLADAGKHVYLVEREPCIGGQMAKFDKTFPTLDCAACILTPKMVQVGQHPNIDLLSYSEVEEISGYVGSFKIKVRRKARYINEDACTGCSLCVENCTWDGIASEFDHGLGTRPVVYKSFPQAVPAFPVIDRAGTSRCTFSCPAGIKAHGYVSLVRKGEYEKAFSLVLEATPLVGSLGRACYAQCEAECTRASLEGPLPIRRLKRFIADAHHRRGTSASVEVAPPNGRQVAVVGSGPAGLTAAWQLARKGYRVKIFEAAPEPGGMLRLAIPGYRLPASVVERDIENVTALGVEIATSTRVANLEGLRRQGYDAILVATGAPVSTSLGVPGADLDGVLSGLEFLEAAKRGEAVGLTGKRVVIVGGGNVAMDAARTARRLGAPEAPGEPEEIMVTDAARTARRLGAPEVTVAYRRGREEMPAYPEEVDAAEHESTRFSFQVAPAEVVGDEHGRVCGLRCVRTELGAPDASGRRRPEPVPGSEFVIGCEVVIAAIGLSPEATALGPRLRTTANGTLRADQGTLQTDVPYVFAAGDVVSGALDIAHAVGRGQRAAFMIDRWLRGEDLDPASFDATLPVVEAADVLAKQHPARGRLDPPTPATRFAAAPADFAELELPLTEAQARRGAGRCLDCGVCSECGQCIAVCEAGAIDLAMRDTHVELDVGAIIVATGYKPFDARRIPEYGYGRFPNVYTAPEVERLLNASGPTQGEIVLRGGGRPGTVGIIHCVGSRDARYNPYCSRVCCMSSLKLAHLIKERTGAEVYSFYIDMRTPGKGYEEFYEKVMKEGVRLIRGRVVEVSDEADSPGAEGKLVLRAEDTLAGVVRQIPVDMVVLAVALEPQSDAEQMRRLLNISCSSEGFFTERHPKLAPVSTFTDGVFIAGACQGPKDIPDTVAQAGAAAAEALVMIDRGSVELEPSTAFVDAARCSGCRTCIGLCPFGALSFDADGNVAITNEVLCKGCGVCVAACPSGAMQQHLFTDEQVLAELEGVLKGV
ncbi:MAG TPA: FAD-dependent oxidoreductase [Streptosporangiaceae bacterium]|nr:FAD-dependent oxidoreductase [Streptosporangiaceae bacterium]